MISYAQSKGIYLGIVKNVKFIPMTSLQFILGYFCKNGQLKKAKGVIKVHNLSDVVNQILQYIHVGKQVLFA